MNDIAWKSKMAGVVDHGSHYTTVLTGDAYQGALDAISFTRFMNNKYNNDGGNDQMPNPQLVTQAESELNKVVHVRADFNFVVTGNSLGEIIEKVDELVAEDVMRQEILEGNDE